jgi:hypothetical protein
MFLLPPDPREWLAASHLNTHAGGNHPGVRGFIFRISAAAATVMKSPGLGR